MRRSLRRGFQRTAGPCTRSAVDATQRGASLSSAGGGWTPDSCRPTSDCPTMPFGWRPAPTARGCWRSRQPDSPHRPASEPAVGGAHRGRPAVHRCGVPGRQRTGGVGLGRWRIADLECGHWCAAAQRSRLRRIAAGGRVAWRRSDRGAVGAWVDCLVHGSRARPDLRQRVLALVARTGLLESVEGELAGDPGIAPNDRDDAASIARQVGENPYNLEARSQRAVSAADASADAYRLARQQAEAAVRIAPWEPRFWLLAGAARYRAGDTAGAREALARAEALEHPSNLRYLVWRALILQRRWRNRIPRVKRWRRHARCGRGCTTSRTRCSRCEGAV